MTHVVNRLVTAVLRSRFHALISQRVMLLTFTGRSSGRTITTPVNFRRDGAALMTSTRGLWQRSMRSRSPHE